MSDHSSADLLNRMISRLPGKPELSVPDVCAALNKHRDVVMGWVRSGEVDAIDLGGGDKEEWMICRSSLESMLRRRAVGVRARAERRLARRQLELFPQ